MNIIFDMDGTICFKGQPISKKLLDCFIDLQEAGHTIGFASARPPRDMLPILDERFANHLLIGANGAITYHRGAVQHLVPIPRNMANEIMEILDDYQAEYLIDDQWNYAFNGSTEHPFILQVDPLRIAHRVEFDQIESVLKILVLSCAHFKELAGRVKKLGITLHYHSSEGILDLTYTGVNKMAALQQNGIQPNDFVCFGNDMNDLPMFEKAAYSVLVGEYEPLRRIAKHRLKLDDQVEQAIIDTLYELAFEKVSL